MNILYIWDADYPWDVRAEKICTTLMVHGHGVHIAARNLNKWSVYENRQGLHIHRIRVWEGDRVNYVLSFPAFFSPIWKHFLDSIIRSNQIELIIVRDLPMAIAGIWAGQRNKIPVIFDMAEDYVAMIWDIWRARKYRGLNLIVRNPYLAKLVERYTFQKADHILVVIDEARDLVIARGGDPNSITIIGNTPMLSSFHKVITNNDNEILKKMAGRYSIIYTGGIQMGRGIQIVFDAIPEVIKHIPDLLFVIVGDGYATEGLKNTMYEKNLQDYILWVGWVAHEQIFDYINASKIGIIPHLTSDHVNTTIPNKIFDYMGAGIPVIASDAPPMKRILEYERCGVTFESGNASSLSRAIVEVYKNEADLGFNGKMAIENKYNWDRETNKLLEVVDKFAIH